MAANFTRTVSLVEIWAHPTEGGARRVYLQYRTADGGALTTITTVDTTRYLCRKKGGGATRSFNATTGEITTDGDYFFIPFTAAITMTDLKVWVTDSNDQYARICEVKAYREVDWTDRATALTVSQDADAALRRFRARTLTLGLSNTDGYLSYYGSDGGYNTEVGAGVVLRVYIGYEGTEKISQGVFYVDKWDEDPAKAAIKVSARDGAGVMGAEVRPNLKTRKTLNDIIEYLGNLCGIASTDMNLQSVAQRVSYFLPEGGSAWTECQKAAEAGSFSSLYFDSYGYLTFISHTNIPGLTFNQDDLANNVRFCGAMARSGDYLYGAAYTTDGGSNVYVRIARYDLAAGTWSYYSAQATAAIPAATVASGLCAISADGARLYVAGANALSYSGLEVKEHITATGAAAPFPFYIQRNLIPYGIAGGFTDARATTMPSLTDGDTTYFAWGGIDSTPSLGIWAVTPDPSIGTGSQPHANFQAWAIVKESGYYLVLGRNTSAGGLQLYEAPSPLVAATWTLRATIGSGDDLRPTGMAATGLGYVYINYSAVSGTGTGRFTKVTVPGWVVTTTSGAWASEAAPAGTWARDAVLYHDGLVIAAVVRPGTGASTQRQDLVLYSEVTGIISNLGPLGISGSVVTALRAYSWSRGTTILGILDGLRVFEIRPGSTTIARQDASIATLQDKDMLSALSISVGDARAESTAIVNRVSVMSAPLIASTSETVWKMPGLPIRVRADDELTHRVQLTDDVDPTTLAASVTYSGAAATIYLDGTNGSKRHHRAPTIVIKVTTGGTITAFSLTANVLRPSSLILEAFGPAASLKRYRFRRMQIDNPYIYDSIAQSMIANDVLNRMSFPSAPPIQLSGVKSLALWHLEPLDRITVVHAGAGINADFYVVRFRHDYRSQTTDMDLMAVPE